MNKPKPPKNPDKYEDWSNAVERECQWHVGHKLAVVPTDSPYQPWRAYENGKFVGSGHSINEAVSSADSYHTHRWYVAEGLKNQIPCALFFLLAFSLTVLLVLRMDPVLSIKVASVIGDIKPELIIIGIGFCLGIAASFWDTDEWIDAEVLKGLVIVISGLMTIVPAVILGVEGKSPEGQLDYGPIICVLMTSLAIAMIRKAIDCAVNRSF